MYVFARPILGRDEDAVVCDRGYNVKKTIDTTQFPADDVTRGVLRVQVKVK